MSCQVDNKIIDKFMEKLKATLMLYTFSKDYLSYGTRVSKRKDGKYKIDTMEGTWYHTLKSLAEEWDLQDPDLKRDVLNEFRKEILEIPYGPIPTIDLNQKQKEYYISFQDDEDVVKDLKRVINKPWSMTISSHPDGNFSYALMICNEEYDMLTEKFAREIYDRGDY